MKTISNWLQGFPLYQWIIKYSHCYVWSVSANHDRISFFFWHYDFTMQLIKYCITETTIIFHKNGYPYSFQDINRYSGMCFFSPSVDRHCDILLPFVVLFKFLFKVSEYGFKPFHLLSSHISALMQYVPHKVERLVSYLYFYLRITF